MRKTYSGQGQRCPLIRDTNACIVMGVHGTSLSRLSRASRSLRLLFGDPKQSPGGVADNLREHRALLLKAPIGLLAAHRWFMPHESPAVICSLLHSSAEVPLDKLTEAAEEASHAGLDANGTQMSTAPFFCTGTGAMCAERHKSPQMNSKSRMRGYEPEPKRPNHQGPNTKTNKHTQATPQMSTAPASLRSELPCKQPTRTSEKSTSVRRKAFLAGLAVCHHAARALLYQFHQASVASDRSEVSGIHQCVMLPTSARGAQEVCEPLTGIQARATFEQTNAPACGGSCRDKTHWLCCLAGLPATAGCQTPILGPQP